MKIRLGFAQEDVILFLVLLCELIQRFISKSKNSTSVIRIWATHSLLLGTISCQPLHGIREVKYPNKEVNYVKKTKKWRSFIRFPDGKAR